MSTISGEEAFATWAPEDGPWSLWAKPIAFVQGGGQLPSSEILDSALPSIPFGIDSTSAVIVDLPGAEAVFAGLALADRGFRPVPLFNGTSGPSPVIDVMPIAWALGGGASRLRHSSIAAAAPPAFLLDSRRHSSSTAMTSGLYDNRWITLPQDFPSGALLLNRDIRSATLLQTGSMSIPLDLSHVLRRWQDAGIRIDVIDLATGHSASAVSIPRPSLFRTGWYVALALMGARRNNVGGFGSVIPEDGGGFFG